MRVHKTQIKNKNQRNPGLSALAQSHQFLQKRLHIFNANNVNMIDTRFAKLNLKLYFTLSDWRPVFANRF